MSVRWSLAASLLILALSSPLAVSAAGEDLKSLGARASSQFRRSVRIEPAEAARSRALGLAARHLEPILRAASGPGVQTRPTTLAVYASSVPNGLCFPDGSIFLSSALLDLAAGEQGRLEADAVAFCLAHELSHLCLQHHARQARARQASAQKLPLAPAALLQVLQAPMERDLELEADRYALFFCIQGGANPETLLGFLDRLRELVPAAQSGSHPAMHQRVTLLREEYNLVVLPAINNWRRGMRDRAAGDFGEAAEWFGQVEKVLAFTPAVPHNLGCALLEQAWSVPARGMDQPVVLPVAVRTLAGRSGPTEEPIRRAREAFDRALQRNASFAPAAQGRAICDYLLGHGERALQTVRALPKGSALALTLEGALLHSRNTPGAASLYRRAMALDPDYWPARYNLALLADQKASTDAPKLWAGLAQGAVPQPWAGWARARSGLRKRSLDLAAAPAPGGQLALAVPGGTLQPGTPSLVERPPGVETESDADGPLTKVLIGLGTTFRTPPLGPEDSRQRYLQVLGAPSRTMEDLGSRWLVWERHGFSARFVGEVLVERLLFEPEAEPFDQGRLSWMYGV